MTQGLASKPRTPDAATFPSSLMPAMPLSAAHSTTGLLGAVNTTITVDLTLSQGRAIVDALLRAETIAPPDGDGAVLELQFIAPTPPSGRTAAGATQVTAQIFPRILAATPTN